MPIANRFVNRRGLAAGIAVLVAVAIGGCGSGSAAVSPTGPGASSASHSAPAEPTAPAGSGTPAPVTAADWPTFGHDVGRSGVGAAQPAISRPKVAWTAALDGAVYGQPIVIGDAAYAGTEGDSVYALDTATGAVRWSRHLGTPVPLSDLPCGDIDPLGITSALAYDAATGQVFAVAETTGGEHTLYGLDARTGAIRLKRNVDPPKGDRIAHQQRSALTVTGGRVYVAYGGLDGDCAQYVGSVIAAPTTGSAPNLSYAIPTPRQGGIWAPGGGVLAPNGRLMYAVGNGAETGGAYDGSDSVIALDPATLRLVDRFSPTSWASDNANDLDLGSMTPAVVGRFIYADGKEGSGYVLDADHLGGIGGNIAIADVCRAFGAAAVSGSTVYVPCSDSVRAVSIGSDGKITAGWTASVPANGSPVLGGGALWVIDWNDGTLYGLDPRTGAVRSQVGLGVVPHFATPSLSRGVIFVGTMKGVTALK
jgi:outer membrane protein assembly factor BamB